MFLSHLAAASLLPVLSSAAAQDGPPSWTTFAPIPIMLLAGWFLIFQPQMRQQKAHKAKIEALKKGDTVLTGGGLIGKITRVDADHVEVELCPGMKVKALKSTITDIIPPTGSVSAND